LVAVILCVPNAWGQSNRRAPRVGYLYPAGGRQGSVFQITAGGQFLRGVSDAYVSGEGVRARVIKHFKPVRNIDKEQRQELERRFRELRQMRIAELPEEDRDLMPGGMGFSGMGMDASESPPQRSGTDTKAMTPIEHPLLHDLEDKSLRELQHAAYHLRFPRRKRQRNTQIGETVLIEIAIDPGAAPGDRELRLETPLGLTNPMVFQVGQVPEVYELEPNDPNSPARLPTPPPLDLPVLLNGQVMPGDVDRFRFRAQPGQQLVIEARARRLIPYLADAVPGWFQATLALYDPNGTELAFTDDYRFDPDPVLFYEIPAHGIYKLEIRDSIYRGREDFVYRIAVGERPFITQSFPLGGRTGVKTVASIDGWNLWSARLPLDTQPGVDRIRQTVLHQDGNVSNRVTYAVDSLPECEETEPNDTAGDAQQIDLPRIVNGRIARPGDVDLFRFEGRAGDEVVAEVYARRLHSPLDSLLRLTDASGNVLELNDDHVIKDGHLHKDIVGLVTHHADSYLRARLPNDGIYYLHLADSQHHGSAAHAYRVRIGSPRPDFALRVTPSSINVPAGSAVPVSVHALRRDGFDGDIEVVVEDAPAGFVLDGGRIPGGRDRVRMTLTAPPAPLDQPVVLQLQGRAWIDGHTVTRPVVPVEDMMQAFLYRHLVPSQELMVAVPGRRRGVPVTVAGDSPVRIPEGGTANVLIKTPRRWRVREREVVLELDEPPEGVTLQDVTAVPEGLVLLLKADGDAVKAGFEDNLIVEAFTESAGRKQRGNAPAQKRQVSLGVLPAIPFEIVQR